MATDQFTPTPQALRTLSHPIRLRLLGLLRAEGPSTASRLAERLELNSGATSYHLRQLAAYGFVEDEPERGDGRDRWWRAAHRSTQVDDSSPDPETQDAADAFSQAVAVVHTDSLQRAVEERPKLPMPWRRISTVSDWMLRLTPEQAALVLDQVFAVLQGWQADASDPDEAPAEAADVVIQVHAFPRPGQSLPGADQAGGQVATSADIVDPRP